MKFPQQMVRMHNLSIPFLLLLGIICWSNIGYSQCSSNFKTSKDTLCSGDSITITNQSTGNNLSYEWKFLDTNGSTLKTKFTKTPTYAFTNQSGQIGNYTVKLIISNSSGCEDTAEKNLGIKPEPDPGFKMDSSAFCQNGKVNFTNQSSGNGLSYRWDFGDPSTKGDTALTVNPSYTYNDTGTFKPELKVTNQYQCSSKTNQSVIVAEPPNARFKVNDNCKKLATSFSDQSQVYQDTVEKWDWDFGDGSTSTKQQPSNQYSTKGTYEVTFEVTTFGGCVDSIKDSVTIHSTPSASIADSTICKDDDVGFTGSKPGSASSFQWEFDDGQIDSRNLNPFHVYANSGKYQPALAVTYSDGRTCRAKTDSLRVFEKPQLEAGITTADTQCSQGNEVCLKDSSASASKLSLTNRTVIYGDGSSDTDNGSTAKEFCHSYNQFGNTYDLKLTITNAEGCQASKNFDTAIYIRQQWQANFNTDYETQCFGTPVTFKNQTGLDSAKTDSFRWDFGDGGSNKTNWTDFTRTYNQNGSFSPKLTVTSQYGCTKSATLNNGAENVDFKFDITASNDTICFQSDSFELSQPPIANANFTWFYGDGTSEGKGQTGWTTEYDYSEPGQYIYKLKVSNGDCDTTSEPDTVEVIGVKPSLSDPINQYQCDITDSVIFVDTQAQPYESIHYGVPNVNRIWDFGDTTAPSCTTNTAINKNVNKNCRYSRDSLVVTHDYPPDQPDCYKTTLTFTDPASGCQSSQSVDAALEAPVASPDTSHEPPLTGAQFEVSDECLGPELRKRVRINFSEIQPRCDYEDHWVMWDSACARQTGNFDSNWRLNETSHSYGYDEKACENDGTRTIGLVIKNGTDSNGNVCYDTAWYTDIIQHNDVDPRFSSDFNPKDRCPPNQLTFSLDNPSEQENVTSYTWKIDDTTIVRNNPTPVSYNFKDHGEYEVSLIIEQTDSCIAEENQNYAIGFRSGFTASTRAICKGGSVTFEDSTKYWDTTSNSLNSTSDFWSRPNRRNSNLETLKWDFGDGQGFQGPLHDPEKIYDTIGSYDVRLAAKDSSGCRDTVTKRDFIKVYGVNTDFGTESKKLICTPTAQFRDSSRLVDSGTSFKGHPGDSVVRWEWDFGDGKPKSFFPSPLHNYTQNDTFQVQLITESNKGCSDTATEQISIPGPKPEFSIIDGDTLGCKPFNAEFTNQSTNTSSYIWKFGDSANNVLSTKADTNVNFRYQKAGEYNVYLTGRDSVTNPVTNSKEFCRATYPDTTTQSKAVVKVREQPNPDFSTTIGCGDKVSFSENVSTTKVSSIAKYRWKFDTLGTSTDANPAFKFQSADKYEITLTATTQAGCKDSTTRFISIPYKPSANFTANKACVGDAVTFTDKSSVKKDSIKNWLWQFGDGSSSVSQNPQNTYTSGGNYQVSLIVTSYSGCKDTFEKTIGIPVGPSSSFTVGKKCSKQDIKLQNNTTTDSGNLTYDWHFGDGTSAKGSTPNKTYTNNGSYTITLIATSQYSNFSCRDSSKTTISIEAAPSAKFSVNNSCLNEEVAFNNQTSANGSSISSYSWEFDDGSSASTSDPTYQYSSSGQYNPELVASSSNGCKDTATETLEIYVLPDAGFNAKNACEQETIQFQNSSSISTGSLTYDWDFGDGNTSTKKNPGKAYTSDGNYQVELIATSGNGCKDTANQNLTINQRSQPDFGFNDTCEGNSVSFTNKTTGPGGTKYQWSFGDGGSSTSENPDYKYDSNGVYDVILQSTTPKNCIDSQVKAISIYPRPNSGYTVKNNCVNQNVNFRNQSTIDSGTITYQWDFGDGSSSSKTNPVNTYNNYQNYTVTLTATTNQGCVDDTSGNIQPFPNPKVAFSVQDTCVNQVHDFQNRTTIAKGSLNYNWDFRDGSSSTKTNPSHIYNVAKTYNPKLKATSNEGCQDSISKSVRAFSKPSAQFNFTNKCQPKAIPFQDQSSTATGNSISSYSWAFGDGNRSSIANPSHKYGSYGDYDVSLRITNNRGCKDTAQQEVTSYAKPNADFTANVVCRPEPTNFTDKSSIARGSLQSFSWKFEPGGGTSTNQNPTYTYPSSGKFTPQLIVTSQESCKDTVNKSVKVDPRPNPGFRVNDTCLNQPTAFNDTSNIESGSIASREWKLGDGATITNNQTFTYTYSNPKVYQPKLIATSNNGCIDSTNRKATVQFLPEAGFSSDTVCFGQKTSFNDSSKVKQSSLAEWRWKFGDDSTSTAQNPKHAYPGGGTYPTELIVRSNQGCLDTVNQNTKVNYKPVGGFKVDPVCFPQASDFEDTSKVTNSTILQWNWDFGDGSSANIENPEYQYNKYGSYETRLIATSEEGCKDTVKDTARVNPKPEANFTFADTCEPNPIDFNNNSTVDTGSITDYNWNFDDQSISNLQNPVHQYDSFGRFEVELTVETGKGCIDSVFKEVEVFPKPSAAFSVENVCRVDTANFKDSSSVPKKSLEAWNWEFGDGKDTNITNPVKTYNAADTYDVQLIVRSTDGCKDTAVNPLIIYPMPQSNFTTNDTMQCLESENFEFTNETQILWGSSDYRWRSFRLSDTILVDTTFGKDYQRKFKDTGDYKVKLKATSNFGCVTYDSQVVKVFPDPVADFGVTSGCINAPLKVFDQSQVGKGVVDSWQWRFGNNTLKTSQNPAANYDTGGVYNIQLVATTNIGCNDTVDQLNRIYGVPESALFERVIVKADSFNQIEWEPSPSPNPGFYELYRSTTSAGSEDRLISKLNERDSIVKDFNALVDSHDYYYTLVFRDSCGIPYPHLNYGRSINLGVENDLRYPKLTFNSYEGWDSGVRNYQVQWRAAGSNNFRPVKEINGSPFKDSLTREFGNPYCYRVVARKKGSPTIVSASNESCVNSESRIFVPSAFSPNDDGENDRFRPKGSYVIDYNLQIYSRWGELIFESNDRYKAWDGTYKGEKAPTGVYQYVLEITGTEGVITKKGTVTLIR